MFPCPRCGSSRPGSFGRSAIRRQCDLLRVDAFEPLSSPIYCASRTEPCSTKMRLKSVGVVVAIADATDDPTTRSLLERAGVARKMKAGGRYKGGDILIPGGLGEDPKPLVIDLTIVNERAPTHLSHPWPAELAEMKKCSQYRGMYDKIAYGIQGFGMEIGGRLGPAAENLIQLAQGLWWEANGKKALPAGANWTCPSFSSYWRQRFVGVVQRFNALMVRGRARRVAQLRVVQDLTS